ncbi:TetR/AcrR family transcriptional regulator [Saccharopolyspora taberi]|uniref:TetR family transcriptional regulator n=1 Tax=Saccharopolyspora taberi TaxID=60895 RepID=A0ABN3VEQ1_9PSEU
MGAGLRERKKQQTRQTISDHATRLFIERGFEKVTIAEIAAAAEVAKMTVTNYFPRKEDLALDIHEEFVAAPAAAVAAREPGESALAALRRHHLAAIERRDAAIGFASAPFARMVTGSPVLLARLRELHEQRAAELARVLADDPGDITPRVVAALLAGVLRLLFDDVLQHRVEGRSEDETAALATDAAQQAFSLLEPSLADYAVRDVR